MAFIVALQLLALGCIVDAQFNRECYYAPNKKAGSAIIPCTDPSRGITWCCQNGDICLSDLACWNPKTNVTYQYGCTDSMYEHDNCPKKCNLDMGVFLLHFSFLPAYLQPPALSQNSSDSPQKNPPGWDSSTAEKRGTSGRATTQIHAGTVPHQINGLPQSSNFPNIRKAARTSGQLQLPSLAQPPSFQVSPSPPTTLALKPSISPPPAPALLPNRATLPRGQRAPAPSIRLPPFTPPPPPTIVITTRTPPQSQHPTAASALAPKQVSA